MNIKVMQQPIVRMMTGPTLALKPAVKSTARPSAAWLFMEDSEHKVSRSHEFTLMANRLGIR